MQAASTNFPPNTGPGIDAAKEAKKSLWNRYLLPDCGNIPNCMLDWTAPPLLKYHKAIGFLSNTGPDSFEKSQTYQASIQC